MARSTQNASTVLFYLWNEKVFQSHHGRAALRLFQVVARKKKHIHRLDGLNAVTECILLDSWKTTAVQIAFANALDQLVNKQAAHTETHESRPQGLLNFGRSYRCKCPQT
ncbi:MAG: hypothetical protein ACPGLY_23615 [Rubripirellula sp.]